jgi:hypothetical protein
MHLHGIPPLNVKKSPLLNLKGYTLWLTSCVNRSTLYRELMAGQESNYQFRLVWVYSVTHVHNCNRGAEERNG